MPRAPKICNENGCTTLVYDGGRYCEDHQKHWQNKGFDKRRTDTAEHRALRKTVLDNAHHLCQLRYAGRCIGLATQVDRIDNAGDYTEDNCQAVCEPCHQHKTSIEGHRAQGHRV